LAAGVGRVQHRVEGMTAPKAAGLLSIWCSINPLVPTDDPPVASSLRGSPASRAMR
jgi:hypothetical protein